MFRIRAFKGITILLLITVISMFSFTGCYGESPFSGNTIVFAIPADEETIDPALNQSIFSATFIENSFEGLIKVSPDGKVEPGVADKWELSPDKKTYTFHLRGNAVWSDDKSVIAENFKFAWERLLNKEINSPYTNYAMCIKGARDYYEGKADTVEGIEVVDDFTMKVTLNNPTPYFLEIIASHPFVPVRDDVVKYKNWSRDPEKYISNGPLTLKSIVDGKSMVYERNIHYWDEENVKLDKLIVNIIPDEDEVIKQFRLGKVDYINGILSDDIDDLFKKGEAQRVNIVGTYMYSFNLTGDMKEKNPEVYKVLNNKNIRKALSLAIDREFLVKNISHAGERPADSIIPPGIKDYEGKEFKNKSYLPIKGDIKEAQRLLKEAGYPNGKGFPEIELLYGTSVENNKIAKGIKDIWKKNLGINIKLEEKDKKTISKRIEDKDINILREGWIADYNDPTTFLKLFESGASGNNLGYSNKELDRLMKEGDSAKHDKDHTELYHKVEDIIMDDMPTIPLFFYVNTVCVAPNVKGIERSAFGNITFYTGYKTNKVE